MHQERTCGEFIGAVLDVPFDSSQLASQAWVIDQPTRVLCGFAQPLDELELGHLGGAVSEL
jgi:hypothetical protein